MLPANNDEDESDLSNLYTETFNVTPTTNDYTEQLLTINDNRDFELFIINTFKKNGFNIYGTKISHDKGADVIADIFCISKAGLMLFSIGAE